MQHSFQPQVVLLVLLRWFAWWLVDCKVWVQVGNLGWMGPKSVGMVNWFIQGITWVSVLACCRLSWKYIFALLYYWQRKCDQNPTFLWMNICDANNRNMTNIITKLWIDENQNMVNMFFFNLIEYKSTTSEAKSNIMKTKCLIMCSEIAVNRN